MSQSLIESTTYYSYSSESKETEVDDSLTHKEIAFINKQRSKSCSNNKRRAARRRKKPADWFMDYFCPLAGTETPRFTFSLPDPSDCVPPTPKFQKINTGEAAQTPDKINTMIGSP